MATKFTSPSVETAPAMGQAAEVGVCTVEAGREPRTRRHLMLP
jgi:hypothetical protein